jgi:uncharacterized protein (DUF1015 family)
VAVVRPFAAVRPSPQYAEKVISLPYDVMSREEAKKMAAGNPYSFLHICRSEIDLPDEKDPYSPEVYEKAKSNIFQFIEEGVLIQEEQPMLYIYRQTMDGRVQTGIVGCVSIDEYLNNVIKKHEFTRVEKELDRINHFDVCNTNTEPVFLTHREDKRLRTIIEDWIKNNKAEYDFVTEDGIGHALWAVSDVSVLSTITNLFKEMDSLYIADGHHRSASAVKVGLKRREENPTFTGDEEFNFFMAVLFPDEDLKIFDYNRVVQDLNGLTDQEFMDKLKENFTLEAVQGPYVPEQKHHFGMFLSGKWYKLIAKPQIISNKDLIQSLDVSILQDNVLAPILGITDPRADNRIDFVGGIRGLEELERRVSLDMKVTFALYPVLIGDLLDVSDQGLVMPPKSTWFEPKLGSGLFMHRL